MLYAGEDPRFIARRMVISAAEDIGNADPNALQLAVAAAQGVDFIGMPEGRILLSQAAIYLACAPKTNSAITAIDLAMEDVMNVQISGIPAHLRDAHYSGASQLGNGEGYKYPHAYPNNYVSQQYLPEELINKNYYYPSQNGYEATIRKIQNLMKSKNNNNK